MTIIVTVTGVRQVGIDQFRTIHTSKIFDENSTFKKMIAWAKTVDSSHDFHSLMFSVADQEEAGNGTD